MTKLKEFGNYKKLNSIADNELRIYLNNFWNKKYSLYDDIDLFNKKDLKI